MPGRRLRRTGIAAALGMIALSTVPAIVFDAARADAYIYWADSQNLKIGRANNDGSGVDGNFISSTGTTPFAVAVDSAHVYWANQGTNSIGRANIDGSGVNNGFITGVFQPTGVAVNASSIFWSSNGGPIGRASINGTGKNSSFVTGPTQSCGIALDSGHIYWADLANFGVPAYIGRSSLDGTNKLLTFATIPGTSFPCGVAVNASNIYWSEPGFLGGGTRIGRANINGGGPDPSFIGDASTPCGVAVFDKQLFWTNTAINTIARANTDGTGVDEEFLATGANQPCGVAIDALTPPPPPPNQSQQPAGAGVAGSDRTAPQTSITAGPGKKVAVGKARFSFKSSEAGSTFQCKIDGRKPTVCRSPRSYSGLKPGRHTFRVWATDRAGNKDPTPAKRRFTVPASA